MLYIQKKFEDAFSSLKLTKNHLLFIDGIDIRPSSIPYDDYLECIKGLANAVWETNNDFFPSIRDSKGRLRTVLLIRPDIYASLGLQNQNTKIRDNSVLLDWGTTYKEHRSSNLFYVSDQLLKRQQTDNKELSTGESWDHYFPFDTPNLNTQFETPSSFVSFLRFALYRPRDIITMLSMLQESFLKLTKDANRAFSQKDFDESSFRRNYADYLLGEIKDQLSFYYGDNEYESFLKFFEFLKGKNRFTYQEYEEAYCEHEKFISNSSSLQPRFMTSPSDFLQFLYDLNIICYIEKIEGNKTFIHWCFKERTYSNISPKIKLEETYEIFYGISKALNTGKKLNNSKMR